MKYSEMNRLEKAVYRIMRSDISGYSCIENMESDYSHGCASGIIGELIYYKDTIAWFKRYRHEISELLKYSEIRPSDIKGFDDDDLFCEDTYNQNLLAWFSFEYVAFDIFNDDELRKNLARKCRG